MPLYHTLCRLLTSPSPDLPWDSLSPEDWGALGSLSKSHGVAPLLHYLSQTQPWGERLPADLRGFLAREYYASVAHSQILSSELERILAALSTAGNAEGNAAPIPVVVLKGASLAWTLYPDPALRSMNDLDLLVHPEHLFPAIKALKAIGYRQQKITYHAVLAGGQASRTNVEIHWCQLPSAEGGPPPDPWFWQQSLPFQFPSGGPADGCYSFNPTANLLYLCTHLALAHGTADPRLVWLWDIHLLIQRAGADLDWDELLAAAGRFGWNAALSRSLNAVVERLDTVIPENIKVFEIAPSNTETAPDEQGLLLDTGSFTSQYTSLAQRQLSFIPRLRALAGLLFPSIDYMRSKYKPKPEWIWPFSYIYRWFYIFSQ